LSKTLKIVKTYWHDHSLDRSRGALSDVTIGFSNQPFSGEKCISWIFLKNPILTLKSFPSSLVPSQLLILNNGSITKS
jgi:hypothetical protein